MENQFFAIESTFWKAIAIKEGELWLSQDKVKNFEKFEKGIQKSGLLKSAYAYPLTSVSEISFNEATESIKLRYLDEKLKPLLLNAIYLIISIVATILFATLDDTSELTDSGSGRQRIRGAFVKMIVDTIGQTGIILIGSLISIYKVYQLYNRFNNPAIEVVYQK